MRSIIDDIDKYLIILILRIYSQVSSKTVSVKLMLI